MKKIVLCVLSLAMLLSLCVFAQEEQADESKVINVVRLLEIMNGDQNGQLNLSDNVTRSEFVKMAVCASPYKSAADAAAVKSLFPDVRSGHWAVRYVGIAISNGWINGYLDGTFRPDNPVKLEEAVNIVLKMLGYTESDLAGAYPEPQMANYKSLKLDKYIDRSAGEYLTRRDCMYLIYNLLNTKNKSGTYYAQTLGYSMDSNDQIDYLGIVSQNTDGPVMAQSGWLASLGIPESEVVVWRDGKLASVESVKDYDVLYYSKLINTVWAYSKKKFGVLQSVSSVNSPNTVTVSGAMYTLGNSDIQRRFSSLGDLAQDDIVVLLLGSDDKAEFAFDAYELDYNIYIEDENDYTLLTQYSLEDAFIAQDDSDWKQQIPFDVSTARIYRNGEPAESGDVKKYDVIYYSDLLKSVWSYDDKKSGIVNGVSPSKTSPSAVILSGTSYGIASDSVSYAFSELGNISEGDVITLLLGRDGMAEGVITADAADSSLYLQGDLDYQQIVNSTIKGPYIVNGSNYISEIPFELAGASVYRNDQASDQSKISEWDVYYYSKPLKTVWVYSNKVGGKYESALPDKAAPASVVVSGKTYNVETSGVSQQLSSAGQYAIGDNITLLLGKNGSIAGVVGADVLSTEVVGIVTDFYNKEYTEFDGRSYTSYCAVISDLDGNTLEYPTNLTYLSKGKMVSVKTSSSGTKISVLAKNYTSLKDLNKAMQQNKYAENAKLADLCGSTLMPIKASRLEGCGVDVGDVIYYKLNANGEVETLVLDDYTGDNHTYVIIDSALESMTTRGTSGRYSYLGANGSGSVMTDAVFGAGRGPAFIEYNGSQVSNLYNLELSIGIDSADSFTALSGGITYDVWDRALVFEYKNGDYRLVSMSQIEDSDGYTLTGWLDDYPNRAGMVRIIIATPTKQ